MEKLYLKINQNKIKSLPSLNGREYLKYLKLRRKSSFDGLEITDIKKSQ